VLQIALVVRLAALTTRLLSGEIGSDPDVELFYNYGRATLELGLPVVEYPSGALIPWAILALPASRELFALALPLCNTVADLAIVWAIWSISERRSSASGNTALACFYALSPPLLPFWHGKYDPLPTAFLALGLMAYTHNRMVWSGAALGIGGALKWTPWLAAAALALGMLRSRSSRAPASLWTFAAGGMMAVAATSIPFALIDWDRFLAPYTLQGGRAITGESVWFLAVLITAPEYWARLPAPWGSVENRRDDDGDRHWRAGYRPCEPDPERTAFSIIRMASGGIGGACTGSIPAVEPGIQSAIHGDHHGGAPDRLRYRWSLAAPHARNCCAVDHCPGSQPADLAQHSSMVATALGSDVCGCSGGAGVAYGDDGAKGARRRLKQRRSGQ
jgi:hypothetical protein